MPNLRFNSRKIRGQTEEKLFALKEINSMSLSSSREKRTPCSTSNTPFLPRARANSSSRNTQGEGSQVFLFGRSSKAITKLDCQMLFLTPSEIGRPPKSSPNSH